VFTFARIGKPNSLLHWASLPTLAPPHSHFGKVSLLGDIYFPVFFFNFNFISYPFPKFRVSNVDNNSFTGIRRSRQDVLELPLFKRSQRHAVPTTKHQRLLLLLTTTGNSQRSRPTARTHSRCPILARAPQNAHFSTLKFFSTLYYTEEPQLDTIQI
jgi:hypothetical protein